MPKTKIGKILDNLIYNVPPLSYINIIYMNENDLPLLDGDDDFYKNGITYHYKGFLVEFGTWHDIKDKIAFSLTQEIIYDLLTVEERVVKDIIE